MNKKIMAMILSSATLLASCGSVADSSSATSSNNDVSSSQSSSSQTSSSNVSSSQTSSTSNKPSSSSQVTSNKDAISDDLLETNDFDSLVKPISGNFTITSTVDGGYTISNNIYTISKAGEYTVSGKLDNGQIVVNASEDEEVKIILKGTSISCNYDSAIYVASASKVTINSDSGTYNEVYDLREKQTNEEDTTGKGAIYACCDLSLTGKGALYVSGSYNNGVHTKDDLKIKNVSLKVEAVNNALKGNDSLTVESGNLTLISFEGDGMKTENSDISSKGNQRGTVSIQNGHIDIFAARDAIDASYDIKVSTGVTLNCVTDKYSKYTTSLAKKASNTQQNASGSGGQEGNTNKSEESTKGLKADNNILINGGNITIYSNDDSIHANRDVTLENGNIGEGNITINGGNILVSSDDDGIHADYDLVVNGGDIKVVKAYEGLEGNYIEFNGGNTVVEASDDGINAAGSYKQVAMVVNGGYIDVTVNTGDVDGIDSNGTYTQTGGFVVTRDRATMGSVASGFDADGRCSITGGTFICAGTIGEIASTGSCNLVKFGSSNGFGGFGGPGGGPGGGTSGLTFTKGDYTISDTDITFSLYYSYTGMWICSDQFEMNKSYTISNGTTTYSWTFTANQVTVSR